MVRMDSHGRNAGGRLRSIPGRLGLSLFFLFFLGMGSLFEIFMIREFGRALGQRSWQKVPCTIVSSEVRERSGGKEPYAFAVSYRYEYGGRPYTGSAYKRNYTGSDSYSGTQRLVQRYPSGQEGFCYVNPVNPGEAVLKRDSLAIGLALAFPLIFLLIGVGGLVGTWRGRGDPKRDEARLGTLPALASRGHLGLASRDEPDAQRPFGPGPPSNRGQDARDTQGQGVPNAKYRVGEPQDALATLRVAGSGRATLRPSASAKAKFLGVTVFALFWNGILAIFVVNAINDFRHGDPSWFGTLFLLPFVAIGVGLMGGVVYQLLATFNPRPTLELSSRVVPLGGTAELSWSFAGQSSRIQELTVTLRGVEEAKYRRGTSTYADRNTFYEMELYRTSEAREIAAGQVGFVLPPDTMHSFEAENNKILWNLDLHGRIKGWPDVKESFKIAVMPSAS